MHLRTRVGTVAASLLMALGGLVAAPSAANAGYGAGATHNVWQVSVSFNCDSPTSPFCADGTGGFWGWVQFDSAPGQQTGTGDGQFAGCGHTTGPNGGQRTAGAGHVSLEAITWHTGQAGPNDVAPGTPTFVIDTYTITGAFGGKPQSFTAPSGDPGIDGFIGDSGFPMTAGHFSFHPAPGVAGMINVAFNPAH